MPCEHGQMEGPHWERNGVTYFRDIVTLVSSLIAKLLDSLEHIIESTSEVPWGDPKGAATKSSKPAVAS